MGEQATKQPPPLPDTSLDFCCVCKSRAAPYIKRDRSAGTVVRYCRTHVPDEFGMHLSLVALLEEEFLKNQSPSGEEAARAEGSTSGL